MTHATDFTAEGLAPWASDPRCSRGRRHAEAAAPAGDAFQLDRDRVVHSTAFRRLVYKTQVFLNHEGDLFRTRLTHSLEVAQLARSIARTLRLNEDLCEAVALAHDLGHTPFGHAGQDALDEQLRRSDPESHGFEHNFQSLRVIDVLEQRYPSFDGLNLSFETREGTLKHCSTRRAHDLEVLEPDGVGRRFIDRCRPGLEAQVCNLADEIAYNTHDIDDGVRSGLLVHDQLNALPLFARFHRESLMTFPALRGNRLLYETLRRMLSAQVDDLIETSTGLIEQADPKNADDVRRMPALIGTGRAMSTESIALKAFLRQHLYRHPKVVETTAAARGVLRDLFEAYVADPVQMSAGHAERRPLALAVTDYIAGMTDRFALREHVRLFGLGHSALT